MLSAKFNAENRFHLLAARWFERSPADLGPRQKRLLDNACRIAGLDTPPDVLNTLTARCQHVAWKYQSMAYAVTLKNTGAAGLDYYAETSVGEFLLSSRSFV